MSGPTTRKITGSPKTISAAIREIRRGLVAAMKQTSMPPAA